jgi:hypothetical protein
VNPNDPATNNGVFTLQEGSTSSITGAVVVPTLGAVLTNGANSSSNCFQLVAYTVLVSSGATLGFSNTGCTAAGALPIGGTPKVTLAR